MAVTASAPITTATCARPCSRAAEATLRRRAQASCRCASSRAQVGVSHAAPRRHFPDKQALLDALAEDGFERLGRDLRAADRTPAGERFDDRLLALRPHLRRASPPSTPRCSS